MGEVFIIGSFSTAVGRFPNKTPKELTRDAYLGVPHDSGIDPKLIGHVWFSNMLLDFLGQPSVKGYAGP